MYWHVGLSGASSANLSSQEEIKMFNCTRVETQRIMEGKASGVTRRYPQGECPHRIGSQLVFVTEHASRDSRPTPFATATIVSVRPSTIGALSRDEMTVEKDGFSTGPEWKGHLNQLYRGVSDNDSVYHISFRIDEMNKL